MPSVAYIDICCTKCMAFVFDEDTGRLMQELKFESSEDMIPQNLDLPEGIESTVVSIPFKELGLRAMDIPISNLDNIRNVLPFELEGLVLGDPQQMVIDAVSIGDGPEGKKRVLAVYIEKKKLGKILDDLKAQGVDPRAVTSSEVGEIVKELRSGLNLSELLEKSLDTDDEAQRDRARAETTNPTLNFRMGEFAYTKETQKNLRMLIMTGALALALILAFSGHLALKATALGNQADMFEKNAMAAYSELFPGADLKDAKGLKYKAEAKVKALKGKTTLYRDADALKLLFSLKDSVTPEVKVTEITVDDKAVVLRGTAPGLGEINSFRDSLEGFLNEVTLTESGADASGGTGFTITAKKATK